MSIVQSYLRSPLLRQSAAKRGRKRPAPGRWLPSFHLFSSSACAEESEGERDTRLQELRKKLTEGPDLRSFVRSSGGRQGNRGRLWKEGEHKMSVEELRERIQKMKQHNPQSSHLSDRFGRVHTYLRISLTERCNLRCIYCMPEDGVQLQPHAELLSTDEIVRLAGIFAAHGVKKIRLTGGEPSLRKDLIHLIERLNALHGIEKIGMTTNGLILSRIAPDLRAAGLTSVNISLDTLEERKFERMTRRRGLDRVLKTIEDAVSLFPEGEVKVNCVLMRGVNDEEVTSFIEKTRELPIYVRFIEWMPFDRNEWHSSTLVPYKEVLERVKREYGEAVVRERDEENDTSKAYRVRGYKGKFGFITSMTEHFCGSCNRLRLTADGNLKVCLFGQEEISLRDALRAGFSSEDLGVVVQAAVMDKKFKLGGHEDAESLAASPNRPMILIGG